MSRVPTGASRALGGRSLDGMVAAALVPHAGPWAGWIVLPLLAFVLRRWAGSDVTSMGLAAATVTAAGVGLAAFVAHLLARRTGVRLHAVASVAAAGLWLLLALTLGARPPIPALWAVGLLVPLTWSIRRIAKGLREGDGTDSSNDLVEKIGLAGARFGRAKLAEDSPTVTVPLHLAPGQQTIADARAAAERLETAVPGLRPGSVRVTPGASAGVPIVTVAPVDVLNARIPWPGPSAPGKSIAEPIEFGRYEDGEPLRLWLPGDEEESRASSHFLIAGMTGTGKSWTGRILLADILTRIDVEVRGVDTVKGLQTFGPVAGAMDMVITDEKEARKLLAGLPAQIKERTAHLTEMRLDQWQRGCGLRYLVIWIEEASSLLAGNRRFIRIAEQARSAGISLVISLQRPTHENLPTSVRNQFAGVLCFGLKEGSAEYVLTNATLDSGADPEAWGASRPGQMYAELLGVPEARWSTPARAYVPTREQLTAAVAGRRPEPSVIPTGAVEAVDDDDQDDEDEPEEQMTVPPSPEPDIPADPEQEIPEDDDEVLPLSLPEPVTRIGRDEAVRRLRAYLRAMADAGHERVTVKQLVEFRQSISYSRPWLSGELSAMERAGELEPDPERGAYKLPAPVGAAASS